VSTPGSGEGIHLIFLGAGFLVSLISFSGATSVLSSWRRY
jgi:hypothetical protein